MKWLVDWFLGNRVAANLLMFFVIVAGGLAVVGMKQEVFPDVAPNLVTVSVVWPGATPEEVEEGIVVKVEEAIEGLEGVKRVTSTAEENLGVTRVELFDDADKTAVLDDVKTRVDSISTLPEDAEKAVVADVESPHLVLSLVVSGEVGEKDLTRIAESLRDDLVTLPELSRAEISNARDYEISIEVSEDALRRYGLRFDDVVAAVRASSLNLSGGTVKTRGGEILLRTDRQAYTGREFEGLPVLSGPDGTRVLLRDVARVVDGFEDQDQGSRFDGNPALTITVFRVGKESTPDVAAAIRKWLPRAQAGLPPGVSLTIWKDWSDLLRQRRDLLLENGKWGLILIFVILALFLRLRLAFWVALGIPVSFLGALWLLPMAGTTINMMSLFGFIVVLGILVDDAIVVGENIHHHAARGEDGPTAAKRGVHEVLVPVVLAVLTTIAAFVPMLSLPGVMGRFARVIPIVVICALTFSLVESLLILPSHLKHLKPNREPRFPFRGWAALTAGISKGLDLFVDRVYRPTLALTTRWRYLTLAVAAGAIVLTAGLFGAGIVRFSFFPPIAGDQVVVSLTMPEGTPVETTEASIDRIRNAVSRVRSRLEGDRPGSIVKHVLVSVGTRPQEAEKNWERGGGGPSGSNLGEIFVELRPPQERGGLPAEEVMRELREEVGVIPGARELKFEVTIHGMGAPIDVQLRSPDLDTLRSAADDLKARLQEFAGTFDISDSLVLGKREYEIGVRPEAEAFGVTQADLSRQVRQAFYGDEAQRIQRGKDDVKVMVRFPESNRRSLTDLHAMRIRTPAGGEIPFDAVAELRPGRGPAAIHRSDGSRAVNVTADVDLAVANTNEIAGRLREDVLPAIAARYPGLAWAFDGEQREQSDTMGGLMVGSVLAVFLIFTLLALAFQSFLQPFIVLSAIPFGLVGAVLGHWLLGKDLTLLSMVGILAMAGVVVNDSMILVDFVNRARARGAGIAEAVLIAGPRRFRAIILTSLTTFAGLAPLLMEKSVQAQFLIPMAISLSFGVMFSTLVILVVVPCLYMLLEDVSRLTAGAHRLAFSSTRTAPAAE